MPIGSFVCTNKIHPINDNHVIYSTQNNLICPSHPVIALQEQSSTSGQSSSAIAFRTSNWKNRILDLHTEDQEEPATYFDLHSLTQRRLHIPSQIVWRLKINAIMIT